jgi:hypothetical protein
VTLLGQFLQTDSGDHWFVKLMLAQSTKSRNPDYQRR